MKSNPNQITFFQIKSYMLKSNHHQWFNHDLNQIVIWICPSLVHIITIHFTQYFAAFLQT